METNSLKINFYLKKMAFENLQSNGKWLRK